MPELVSSQASGLMGLADAPAPQLLAMVSLGDVRLEMPVLWQLCAALTELDHTVTVLDATAAENERNPGLLHHLDCRYGQPPFDTEPAQWTVLPAALAFQELHSLDALRSLGPMFDASSTIVLYAAPELLVRVLAGSAVRPLLCACREKNSLLTSYLALKRLLLQGRLEPTILNMMDTVQHSGVSRHRPVPDNLSDCARIFLGYDVRSITIDSSRAELQRSVQARQLALRLLENALPLQTGMDHAGAHSQATAHGYLSRNH